MQTARHIMTPNPVTISPKASVGEAARLLLERHFNGLPVVDDSGALVGIICQSDLVAQQKKLEMPSIFSLLDGFIPMFGWKDAEQDFKKMTALTVEQAMSSAPLTVGPDAALETVATMMLKSKHYTLPVLEDGKLVGVIGKEDILRTLVNM